MTPTARIVTVFNTAIAILDASEPLVRDLIENELMDVAGFNRTRISQAMLVRDQVTKKIAALRLPYIKKAFRYLRDNLPEENQQIYERSLASWAKAIFDQDARIIRTAISVGLTSGDDNTDIAHRVIGSRRFNGSNGVTAVTRSCVLQLGRGALSTTRLSQAA